VRHSLRERAGTQLRDDLEKDIPSFAALFEPRK
jgi:hypothetical protein